MTVWLYFTFTKLKSVTGSHGLSVISEMHVADMKTEMYLMHGVGKYERNANEKSDLYRFIFTTDP